MSFWSEKEAIVIKDENNFDGTSRHKETVKYRAKSKILRAFEGIMEVENPRIVTGRILVKGFDVLIHMLRLRGFEREAKIVEDVMKNVSAKVLSGRGGSE